MKRLLMVFLLGYGGTFSIASHDDWPHFRGPDQSGVKEVARLNRGKTFGLEIQWQRELGSGYSSISVAGDTGVVMYTDGISDILLAFDPQTGKDKWHYNFSPMYKGHSSSNDGPSGTPTIGDGHVYALGRNGHLVAVTLAEGKKVWEHHLGENVKARVPHYGFNTVPTLVGDSLILMTGSKEGATFTAFQRKSGKILWQAGEDTSTYQSPLVWHHRKNPTVLGVTDQNLVEINPENGKKFWQQKHGFVDEENYSLPVMIGEDRVLILNRRETAAFDLNWNGGKATMKEAWRGNQFQRTYAIPVYHQGYLYGFKSQFLSCINAANGEIMWRSRPPGGLGLTLLGDHLLIVGRKGDLVAVEANPQEYRETAHIKLFDKGSYTPVSHANDLIFIRNLKEMACVKITDQVTMAALESKKPVKLMGEFGKFVTQVTQAADKKAMIDTFMQEQKQFPVIEGDSLVHFIYRGKVNDISLRRSQDRERILSRIDGTDFYYHSQELDPAGHWDYQFRVFGEPVPDPRNPFSFVENGVMFNELRMPKWPTPHHLQEPKGPRGQLEKLELDSKLRGEKKTVNVYLPPGYKESQDRYPLMVVINGRLALEAGKMDWSLDNLIGQSVDPVIVAFVDGNIPEFFADSLVSYSQFIVEELIPRLDQTYRTQATQASRGIMGLGFGASAATFSAFKFPQAFGKLANQSFAYPFKRKEDLKAMIDTAGNDLQVYMEISPIDYDAPHYSALKDSPDLLALLKKKGFKVKELVTAGAPGFGSWRGRTHTIFEWFAPKLKGGDL